ncbi:hypothetical protein IH992_19155 [Candidatus Poribacteria bacterium]|nr:hypothetical protein [Candidatus Poribacteria bacterium]
MTDGMVKTYYGRLDLRTQQTVQKRTDEIKGLIKRAARDVIEIGEIEVKS